MFIEGRSDAKTPFYVHVDVATKLIMGYAMRDKTYGEMLRAIEHVGEQYRLLGLKLERLTFDRETSILAAYDDRGPRSKAYSEGGGSESRFSRSEYKARKGESESDKGGS